MALSIIHLSDFRHDDTINVNSLRTQERRLEDGMIQAAEEETVYEIAPDHSADPIKSMDDIFRISNFLIENGRYRDNMLFITGINFGLRISDLLVLRFSNLIADNLVFRDKFPVFEKKTRNTRKKKKNRYITINTAVIEAVTLYLRHTPGIRLSDYMFRSVATNSTGENIPISIRSVNRMLEKLGEDLELGIHFSTHTLRKTFCYHQMVMSGNDPRKLQLLQKMLNHSSILQTLDYIGITSDEIADAYRELNLGSPKHHYLVESRIIETDDAVV